MRKPRQVPHPPTAIPPTAIPPTAIPPTATAAASPRGMVEGVALGREHALLACDPGLVTALADAGRVTAQRGGWLRSVATAGCVGAAMDGATLTDLFAVYQAGQPHP